MTVGDVIRVPVSPDPGVRDDSDRVRPDPGRGAAIHEILRAAASALDELPYATHQFADSQLAEVVETLMTLRVRSEQVAVMATEDARDRGAIASSTAVSTSGWVAERAAAAGHPVDPRDAHTIAVVAEACSERRNAVIARAVCVGSCTVSAARTALTQADKVAPVLPVASRDDVLAWYLQIDPALGAKGLTTLTRRILATYAADELERGDTKLEAAETLTMSHTPTGMTKLVAELAPLSAAIVRDALLALSAPKSRAADGQSTPIEAGVRDDRSASKRRADALVELVAAGARSAAATDDAGWVGKPGATITVTVPLSVLTDAVGAATTLTGDVLDPGAARRLACDADIIPAVLGGPSEPLDVGRRQRLVTKGIRAAVTLRDQGCTFPGCDRPPHMCEIHHVQPWWLGGSTSVTNSAMLCSRHHQTVHRHGYTATVADPSAASDQSGGSAGTHESTAGQPPPVESTGAGPPPPVASAGVGPAPPVRWDLTPGRLPTGPRPRRGAA